jgi:hypothetical protein
MTSVRILGFFSPGLIGLSSTRRGFTKKFGRGGVWGGGVAGSLLFRNAQGGFGVLGFCRERGCIVEVGMSKGKGGDIEGLR